LDDRVLQLESDLCAHSRAAELLLKLRKSTPDPEPEATPAPAPAPTPAPTPEVAGEPSPAPEAADTSEGKDWNLPSMPAIPEPTDESSPASPAPSAESSDAGPAQSSAEDGGMVASPEAETSSYHSPALDMQQDAFSTIPGTAHRLCFALRSTV
jgi:hypothetical protein